MMGSSYDNSELRRRQQAGDSSLTQEGILLGAFGSDVPAIVEVDGRVSDRRTWKPMIAPVVALSLGLLLTFVSPLPGLGVIMVTGALLASLVVGLQIWFGG
jgi:hypothetical protein